jgi:phosphotransferase family enzyme
MERAAAARRRHVELPAGPYARSFRDLIADHRRILSEVLLAYDRMASLLATDRTSWVITHGEPKINNILITRDGPVMIDWDTNLAGKGQLLSALVCPPERQGRPGLSRANRGSHPDLVM